MKTNTPTAPALEKRVPKSELYKYLSEGKIYSEFPDYFPVITRYIKIMGEDAQVTIKFEDSGSIVEDVKITDILPHIVPTDILVIDSKLHYVSSLVASLDGEEAVFALEYKEVPTPSETTAPTAESLAPIIPPEQAFKYLKKGTSFDNGTGAGTIVLSRVFEESASGEYKVTANLQSGGPVTGVLPYNEIGQYLTAGDFLIETLNGQKSTFIIGQRTLSNNQFELALGYLQIPLLVNPN